MKGSIAILAGGGPAPGINSVIASVSKVFLKDGYRVIGIHEGYKTLFNGKPNMIDLDFVIADKIHNQGGSILTMSRHKPKDSEFNTDFFVDNDVKLLVTIGGDDTASTANRISKYLASNNVFLQNIHVPKTIDNDLPLPDGIPTFGYQSAKQEGVRIATTVYEDARTSGNWFVVSAMGREAGHLAFGIGAACHYPMIIIPEMFDKVEVTFDRILHLVISSMIKRKILGINYGVVIISEGVFHFMTDEEILKSGITFTFDDHGHPELGNVSKAHIFNMLLQEKLKQLKINIKSRPVELGYELRCVKPIAFDMLYCALLGMGVKVLFDQG
ncbi:MAG: 6-phosphofructokinase, partial [Chloroflexota bacterium]